MSANEQLLERVKTLDEATARTLLGWLESMPKSVAQPPSGGIRAARGWIRKYNHPQKTTAEWMNVLREGERD